ncbi:hypothetical protein ACJX0J_031770, partial [Zea mays]
PIFHELAPNPCKSISPSKPQQEDGKVPLDDELMKKIKHFLENKLTHIYKAGTYIKMSLEIRINYKELLNMVKWIDGEAPEAQLQFWRKLDTPFDVASNLGQWFQKHFMLSYKQRNIIFNIGIHKLSCRIK